MLSATLISQNMYTSVLSWNKSYLCIANCMEDAKCLAVRYVWNEVPYLCCSIEVRENVLQEVTVYAFFVFFYFLF
jgi:hypothetical protein